MRLSIRMLTFLMALLAFTALSSFVFFLFMRADETLSALFMQDLPLSAIQEEIMSIILVGGGMLVVFLFVLLITLLLLSDILVVRPLKRLTHIVSSLDIDTPTSFPAPHGSSPEEVAVMFRAIEDMVSRIRQSHSKDAELSRTKSDFISTAAHQLRTPLTGIRWAIEALEKDPALPSDKKPMVKDALEKIKQLVAVVKTLLDVSAIESGKYHYQFAPTNLLDLARSVVQGLEVSAKNRNVLVAIEPPEDMPLVLADTERVRWVMENVVENAIRYTPAQGSVTISFSSAGERVFVYVRDTGIGIPPQDKVNIFERFYRGKTASVKENEGSGLGLYIARNVIRDHKGELSFKNNDDGIGTTFFFSLPVATSNERDTLEGI